MPDPVFPDPVFSKAPLPEASLKPRRRRAELSALQKLQRFLHYLLRQTRGLMVSKALPSLADKTCQLMVGEAQASHQVRCRQLLRSRIHLDPHQLNHFFESGLGHTLLSWFEHFFHLPEIPTEPAQGETEPRHKHAAIQRLLVDMAADPAGLSLYSFVQRFPHQLQLNLDEFLALADHIGHILETTDATVTAIHELAAAEVAAGDQAPKPWPDLTQPGPFQVHAVVTELAATGDSGPAPTTPLQVMYYRPSPWPVYPVPVVLQSHGWASNPEDLRIYAEYLASYGYFVAALRHTGSDSEQVRRLLAGETLDGLQLQEFIQRPRQVSVLLDGLTRRNRTDWDNRLRLDAVGLLGHSFGAYTALALAGADLHWHQLETACTPAPRDLNLSLLLQCQALGLPQQVYSLRDQRIGAIACLDAIGSELFDATSIGQIHIPVLLLAGSGDTTAPLIFEQVRIFQRLQTPHRYLALMRGKSHIRDIQRLIRILNLDLKVLPDRMPAAVTQFDAYINALSLAFFQDCLAVPFKPSPPLDAAYAEQLSRAPLELSLISQRSGRPLQERLARIQRPSYPDSRDQDSGTPGAAA